MRPLPTAIIIGASRSGTTSLFQALATTNAIAPSHVKEPNFFLPAYYGEPLAPPRSYERVFAHKRTASIRLEASTAYFPSVPEVPALIAEHVGEPWIVLVLREPMERFVSEFSYLRSHLRIPAEMTLEAYADLCMQLGDAGHRNRDNRALLAVRNGRYERFFPMWAELFADRLIVLFYDDLLTTPGSSMAALAGWLGIAPSELPPRLSGENVGRAARHPLVHGPALALNNRLERLLRRHPALKALFRDVYYQGTRPASAPKLASSHPLHELHASTRSALRAQLEAWDPALALPGWLLGRRRGARGGAALALRGASPATDSNR